MTANDRAGETLVAFFKVNSAIARYLTQYDQPWRAAWSQEWGSPVEGYIPRGGCYRTDLIMRLDFLHRRVGKAVLDTVGHYTPSARIQYEFIFILYPLT